MTSRAILLKKTLMKNQSGFYFLLLTEDHGFIDVKGFSARRPSKTYLGIDYFRVFELDLQLKKDAYKIDSVSNLYDDFTKQFISNQNAYKFMMYIQDLSFKVLGPLNTHFSVEENKKLFSDFLFLFKTLPNVEIDKFLKIVYRFLIRIYKTAGFIDELKNENLKKQEILNKIKFFNEEFLESSILVPELKL